MKRPRLMISAPASGSGKTLVTCGLLAAFQKRGVKQAAFKCGPDYIDPMFHREILQVPSENLDAFLAGEAGLKQLFASRTDEETLAVLEGAMGLYDGLGGVTPEASAYEAAALTKTPIVLVIDAKGMGYSIIPLIQGFLMRDKEHLIGGVILNRTSVMFAKTIAPRIEEETGIRVFGCLPVQKEVSIGSRHLGLLLPQELIDVKEQLFRVADALESGVDLDALLALAETAAEYPESKNCSGKEEVSEEIGTKVPIAVARDEAFCFYYEENLRMLERAGAELIYFSPLHDKKLPEEAAGFLLGGGYPELYAKKLSENTSMRESILAAIRAKMPSLAECGGFLYLHETLEDTEGVRYPMVGAVRGNAYNTGKLNRFGYVTISRGEKSIRAHEFHYYDSENNGTDYLAVKPVTGRSWKCMHEGETYLWGFPHLYYGSAPWLVERFIKEARKYKNGYLENVNGGES